MNTEVNTSSLKTNVETRELEVFDNTSEFAVKINESKARLVYNKYFKAASGGTILSLIGAFLSCLTTLLTASFNDIGGIKDSAAVLTAIYVMLTVVFFILLIWWIIKWISSLKKLSETAFINELKGQNPSATKGKKSINAAE